MMHQILRIMKYKPSILHLTSFKDKNQYLSGRSLRKSLLKRFPDTVDKS